MSAQAKNTDDNRISDVSVVYEALLSQCTARSRKTLEVINNVCSDISRGSRDFSIANIGALSQTFGGISAVAISNKNGKRYRDLIDAYQMAYPRQKVEKQSPSTDWVETIEDARVQWLVRDLIQEKKRLYNQLNTLRQAWKTKGPVIMLGDESPSTRKESLPSLTNSEIKALSKAVDPKELELRNLSIGKMGEIRDQEGKQVFKVGFVDAIQKILTIEEVPS